MLNLSIMRNIYLTGFMGTGKSAVGRELAKRLNLRLVDIDGLIVRKEKRSINDIFSQNGEPYFRKVESQVLKEVSEQENQVVSCGGGMVLNPENTVLMKQTGRLVCLSARPEVIFERVRRHTHRPLLEVADPLAKIKEMLAARKPYYEQAEFVIDSSDLSVIGVVDKILELIR